MTEIKQYSERDAMELDEAVGNYFRHVLAMTSEGLHSKSKIAAELGWRDMQVAALQEQVRALSAENSKLRDWLISDTMCEVDETAFPATEAIIRETRAQGVEQFAKHLRSHMQDGSPLGLLAIGAEEFAVRILAGEQP